MRLAMLLTPLTALLAACAPEEAACIGTNDGTDGVVDTSTPEDTGPAALDGEVLYLDHCAGCHGTDARGGSERGIDRDVANMPDADLVRIILNGAGEMAPVPVTEDEAYAIVGYIRTIVP